MRTRLLQTSTFVDEYNGMQINYIISWKQQREIKDTAVMCVCNKIVVIDYRPNCRLLSHSIAITNTIRFLPEFCGSYFAAPSSNLHKLSWRKFHASFPNSHCCGKRGWTEVNFNDSVIFHHQQIP